MIEIRFAFRSKINQRRVHINKGGIIKERSRRNFPYLPKVVAGIFSAI
jgi:hypothetical protein